MSEFAQELVRLLITFGLGGGVVGLVLVRSQRRKNDSDSAASDATAAQVITDTALELLAPVREQLADTRARLAEALTEVEHLRGAAAEAREQLQCLSDEYEMYRAMHPDTRR